VSRGTTADIDPFAWRIVDGKLYLNLNSRIQKKWTRDIPGNIKKADRLKNQEKAEAKEKGLDN
jgi:hypothetical protein